MDAKRPTHDAETKACGMITIRENRACGRLHLATAHIVYRARLTERTWVTFRRTYPSWAPEEGVPAQVVAQLMGHAKVDTTLNVYTQALATGSFGQESRRSETNCSVLFSRRQGRAGRDAILRPGRRP